jgi:hypothetical protein
MTGTITSTPTPNTSPFSIQTSATTLTR